MRLFLLLTTLLFPLILQAELAPSAYEAGFVSAAHSDADITATLEAARDVFKTL